MLASAVPADASYFTSMQLVEVEVMRLGVDRTSGTYVVVLKEKQGDRILPIWIGQTEAESIVIEMHGMHRERPLTHDLCKTIIMRLGATVTRVHITRVASRTYYAELHIASREGGVTVDARPSDSIAIALRFNAPIYAADVAAHRCGRPGGERESDADELIGGSPPPQHQRPMSAAELKAYLENLRPEDFGKFQL